MAGPFDLTALLLVLAAVSGFVNVRWLHLPESIALFLLGLAVALAAGGLDAVVTYGGGGEWLKRVVERIDLPGILLSGMLGLLLYAAAVNQDLDVLLDHKWAVLLLATVGVALSTTVLGLGLWQVYRMLGVPVPLAWCLVLGAAVSPTDPVAVHAILARLPVPDALRTVISGESLFNDGVGVVVFTALLHIAMGAGEGPAAIAGDFLREALGGGLLGLLCGTVAYQAKRRVDRSTVELTISLALVMGTFSLAQSLEMSGPIAVVVAGLLIGHTTERHVSSEDSRRDLRVFWSMVDSILNAVLFLLVGLEAVATIRWSAPVLAASALAIPVALAARLVSLFPALFVDLGPGKRASALLMLTWAGLRGGIAVALVLSLPPSPYREPIMAACYAIVAFTILVQGLTLRRVAGTAYRG